MENWDLNEDHIVWRMTLAGASVDPQTSNQPQGEPQDGENHDKAVSWAERGWANQDTAVSGEGASVDSQVGYKPPNSSAGASSAQWDSPFAPCEVDLVAPST